MKKLILSLGILWSLGSLAQASVLTDLWTDIGDNTHLTIAESATPSYLYNAAKGRSEAGITTSVIEYRFLSGDAGYSTGYEDKSKGTVLLGGSIHFDKLAAQLFPKVTALTNAGIAIAAPEGINNIWKKLYIGIWAGRDMNEQDLSWGLQTGFAFKFK